MTWHVPNVGTVDLLDPSDDGVMLLRDGVRGLNMPPVDRYTSRSPAVPGTRWRGFQTQERSVFWPTLVWTPNGADLWHEYDEGLWATLRPDVVGEWEVVTDRAGTRRLQCRWTGDSDHSYGQDPLKSGWAIYGVELVAEQPYWCGEIISASWGKAAGDGRSFLPGPPFWIGSSATVDAAELHNPGDMPAHIVWVVDGPATTAQVGFRRFTSWADGEEEATIDIPFPIAEGDRLVIDTRPTAQTAVLEAADGTFTDRTGDLGAQAVFAPIPPGDEATLMLNLAGDGSITAELEPLFWRAF